MSAPCLCARRVTRLCAKLVFECVLLVVLFVSKLRLPLLLQRSLLICCYLRQVRVANIFGSRSAKKVSRDDRQWKCRIFACVSSSQMVMIVYGNLPVNDEVTRLWAPGQSRGVIGVLPRDQPAAATVAYRSPPPLLLCAIITQRDSDKRLDCCLFCRL